MQEPAQETKESHYIGDGPDFQHSLFNLGGQSPLVSYYLQMHGIPNTLANSRGYRINHSRWSFARDKNNASFPLTRSFSTPLSPTYVDVIQKCKKTSKKLLDHFADFGHKCDAELVVLQEKREKTDRKFRRMLETITTKPTEKRVKIEQFLLQRANAKIHHHGSCGSESGAKDV
ncbi:hypothetical protein NXF25_015652 [Crotalus adamanteus]|uniref:Uncharacterized protein n=1 Tax=Crotalus adamanteus TaxID=8729 RepID=A0AAW1AW40_CROAD